MLKKERSLVEIAGGTWIYTVNITKNGNKVIKNLNDYSVIFTISRHGDGEAKIRATGVFDTVKRNFRVTVPAAQTQPLVGNYIYHIRIITPNEQTVIKNHGYLSVLQRINP